MNRKNVNAALTLLLALATHAGQISASISQAQAQGRDLTDEELEALRAADDRARNELQAAIDQAKAQER